MMPIIVWPSDSRCRVASVRLDRVILGHRAARGVERNASDAILREFVSFGVCKVGKDEDDAHGASSDDVVDPCRRWMGTVSAFRDKHVHARAVSGCKNAPQYFQGPQCVE